MRLDRSNLMLSAVFLVATASSSFASHPTANTETNVTVSFVFPDGQIKQAVLTYDTVCDVLRDKPLPKELYVDTYKIDWWVFGALQKLDLPFKAKTAGSTGYWKTTMEKIGDLSNGPDGEWVYYVNGIRSPYHISTQTDDGVKAIKFVYKSKPNKITGANHGQR